MGFSDDDLNRIYDKTDGYCAHCGKKLSFCNYGKPGRGQWEVDHSKHNSGQEKRHLLNLLATLNILAFLLGTP